MNKNTSILITEKSVDYELLDSGCGEKLERFGSVILSRPDPQALWEKKLPQMEWKKAAATFTKAESAGWSLKENFPDKWSIALGGLKFWIKPTAFKHVGIFPEQLPNWEWLRSVIPAKAGIQNVKNDQFILPEILNLFGYTGGATLACAQAGAKVVHVDSSKSAMTWARENAELSGLADKPIRWILEDARSFVKREIKRGRHYDGIIMDPPAFGHGPDNELWKIEDDFLDLVKDCFTLLKGSESQNPSDDKPLFFLINGYSAGYSALAYENILGELVAKYGGKVEAGELAIEESQITKNQTPITRLLPCGIFARWSL